MAERTRIKGNRYFLGGAVRGIEGTDTDVVATVRGSALYSVHLHRDGDAFTATCQCPYFTDRRDLCKHIWAVVLAADAEGFLLGDALLTEEAYLHIGSDPKRTVDPAPPERHQLPHERWEQFLRSVQQRASARTRPYDSRLSQGEILYVINQSATQADVVPTVQVQHRIRKKNGEWGKPTPAALITEEIAHLPEEADTADPVAAAGRCRSTVDRPSICERRHSRVVPHPRAVAGAGSAAHGAVGTAVPAR